MSEAAEWSVNRYSPTISEIATALAAAQGEIDNAPKNEKNPYFKASYADLASVWSVVRQPLSKHGIAVIQLPEVTYKSEAALKRIQSRSSDGERIVVEALVVLNLTTRLIHKSGEWIENTVSTMVPGADPQTIGSAITYMRRYALMSMTGVAPQGEDDDGNRAAGYSEQRPPQEPMRPPQSTQKPAAPAQKPAQAAKPGPKPAAAQKPAAPAPAKPAAKPTAAADALPAPCKVAEEPKSAEGFYNQSEEDKAAGKPPRAWRATFVRFDNGIEATTFSTTDEELLRDAFKRDVPVLITTQPSKRNPQKLDLTEVVYAAVAE